MAAIVSMGLLAPAGAALGAGAGAAAAGTGAGLGTTFGGTLAAGAISGAVGSAAGQAVSGEGFDAMGIAKGAAMGGASAGLGSLTSGIANPLIKAGARGLGGALIGAAGEGEFDLGDIAESAAMGTAARIGGDVIKGGISGYKEGGLEGVWGGMKDSIMGPAAPAALDQWDYNADSDSPMNDFEAAQGQFGGNQNMEPQGLPTTPALDQWDYNADMGNNQSGAVDQWAYDSGMDTPQVDNYGDAPGANVVQPGILSQLGDFATQSGFAENMAGGLMNAFADQPSVGGVNGGVPSPLNTPSTPSTSSPSAQKGIETGRGAIDPNSLGQQKGVGGKPQWYDMMASENTMNMAPDYLDWEELMKRQSQGQY